MTEERSKRKKEGQRRGHSEVRMAEAKDKDDAASVARRSSNQLFVYFGIMQVVVIISTIFAVQRVQRSQACLSPPPPIFRQAIVDRLPLDEDWLQSIIMLKLCMTGLNSRDPCISMISTIAGRFFRPMSKDVVSLRSKYLLLKRHSNDDCIVVSPS